MQAQGEKGKWIRIVLPMALLLAVCTAATAYFPNGAKATKPTAPSSLRTNAGLPRQ